MKQNPITQKFFIKNEHNELLCGFDNVEYGIQNPIWSQFGAVLAMSGDTAKLVVEKINQQAGKVTAFIVTLTE